MLALRRGSLARAGDAVSEVCVMSETQQTLTGEEATRVTCEYYDGCQTPALFVAEILHYGEGEKAVKMCESCADEHTEVEGNTVQRLKPEDRYEGEPAGEVVYVVVTRYADDPHPHVELVTTDEQEAKELMRDCRRSASEPHPIAWEMEEQRVEL